MKRQTTPRRIERNGAAGTRRRFRKAPESSGLHGVDARQRIIDAAIAVFAREGYRGTTVRAICRAAGVNIASVNYYFRDKEGLYREVLQQAESQSLAKYPPTLGLSPNAGPEERLRGFIRSFLLRMFDGGQSSVHGQLMSREMIEPTAALDDVVAQNIRPRARMLQDILREIIGPSATPEMLECCAMSVVSQCLFQHQCRPVLDRLFPERRMTPRAVESMADHIWRFCLKGLRGIASGESCWATGSPAGVSDLPSRDPARGPKRSTNGRAV